jgi:hypothetical protein
MLTYDGFDTTPCDEFAALFVEDLSTIRTWDDASCHHQQQLPHPDDVRVSWELLAPSVFDFPTAPAPDEGCYNPPTGDASYVITPLSNGGACCSSPAGSLCPSTPASSSRDDGFFDAFIIDAGDHSPSGE